MKRKKRDQESTKEKKKERKIERKSLERLAETAYGRKRNGSGESNRKTENDSRGIDRKSKRRKEKIKESEC